MWSGVARIVHMVSQPLLGQQSAGGPAAGDGSAGGPATSEPAGGPAAPSAADANLDVEIGDPASSSGAKRHGGGSAV